jgi:hypothetical protein
MKNVYLIYHWIWELRYIFNYLFQFNFVKLCSISGEEIQTSNCLMTKGASQRSEALVDNTENMA